MGIATKNSNLSGKLGDDAEACTVVWRQQGARSRSQNPLKDQRNNFDKNVLLNQNSINTKEKKIGFFIFFSLMNYNNFEIQADLSYKSKVKRTGRGRG